MYSPRARQHRRRITLVDQYRLDTEASVQLMREAAAAHGHGVRRAIRMTGQADDAARRAPLRDQGSDRFELAVVGGGGDDCQRLCLAQQAVADGDTDAFEAKVEAEYRFQYRFH